MEDGTYRGVLDRFEGERGVLVLQADGEDIADWVVDDADLPAEGWHENAMFEVVLEDDALIDVTYLSEETEERQERAQDRFDRLSKRPPDETE